MPNRDVVVAAALATLCGAAAAAITRLVLMCRPPADTYCPPVPKPFSLTGVLLQHGATIFSEEMNRPHLRWMAEAYRRGQQAVFYSLVLGRSRIMPLDP